MTQHRITIRHADDSAHEVPLEPGLFQAGSDLDCDLYFSPRDGVPRFTIDVSPEAGGVTIIPRAPGLRLEEAVLPVGSAVAWPPGRRLHAGSLSMTHSAPQAVTGGAKTTTASAPRTPAMATLAAAPRAGLSPLPLFALSVLLTLGYLAIGFLEGRKSEASSGALANASLMSGQQVAAEVRRLTEGWPSQERPLISTEGRTTTIRLQGNSAGNIALAAQIDSFRLSPDEPLSILDIPYSEETFTALGIDGLAISPRKRAILRTGASVSPGETLNGSWVFKDVTASHIAITRQNVNKSIRLKSMRS
jgi:hypothetical protein